jgi:hypothetical protein
MMDCLVLEVSEGVDGRIEIRYRLRDDGFIFWWDVIYLNNCRWCLAIFL